MLLASGLFPLRDAEIEHLRSCCHLTIDWVAFNALVARHGLLPPVYRNLTAHTKAIVQPSVLAELKKRAEFNRHHTLQLLAELGRISQLFAREDIQLCALKGPLLAQRLFGDVSLRTSSDLDLLIHPEALAQADALLLSHGCQRSYPARPLTHRQWRIYQQGWRHFTYFLPERHIVIELHWTIASLNLVARQDVRQMLTRTRPLTLAGASLHTLSEEDLPLYLLIHGSLHSWVRLKWLVDFVIWMRSAVDPDWPRIVASMENLGLLRPLSQGILLARWLFSESIPEPAQVLLESTPAAKRLADHSLKAILDPHYTGAEEGGFQRLREILYRMKLKKSLRYKWKALTTIWAMPKDWLELPLPDALYPLYWLLRPFLWLRRYHLPRGGDRPAPSPPES